LVSVKHGRMCSIFGWAIQLQASKNESILFKSSLKLSHTYTIVNHRVVIATVPVHIHCK
jgi:hypothetical protein